MEQIKNIVFDLGGVLVELHIERCQAAFRSLGMEQIAEIINPYHPAEILARVEAGQIGMPEACDQMRALCNRPEVTDEQIGWAYGQFLIDTPIEKIRMIGELRAAGIKTYALSNNNPSSMSFIRKMFQADGGTMDDYFDKMYLSYEMKLLKPSPEIFRAMTADSGMIPEESLYIDDSIKNAEVAHEQGYAIYVPAPGEDFSHLFDSLLK